MDDQIRRQILSLLDKHRVMALATLRPDGWPQATTVGFADEDLTLYFLCGLDSQKASNLAKDDRVSLTIDEDTPNVMEVTGLSMAGRAKRITDRAEAVRVMPLIMSRYPEQTATNLPMPDPSDVALFRLTRR